MTGELNIEQARANMIEQQIRTWEVLDQHVLDTIAATPREDFVPESFRRLAFADTQIPIAHHEVMMAPKVEARMIQSLRIRESDTVLEIGTGSGYVTALLARMASWVKSVEIHNDLSNGARERLQDTGIDNVTLEVGDALGSWISSAAYDAVVVTGSLPQYQSIFEHYVKLNGRLFVIVGAEPVMEALLLTRIREDSWSRESLFETVLPPLVGAVKPPAFVF